MNEKPENFVITPRERKHVVERHFEFPNGDFISFRQTIGPIQDNPDPTIKDLHCASSNLVIRYLLTLLPEGYGQEHPFVPGAKTRSK